MRALYGPEGPQPPAETLGSRAQLSPVTATSKLRPKLGDEAQVTGALFFLAAAEWNLTCHAAVSGSLSCLPAVPCMACGSDLLHLPGFNHASQAALRAQVSHAGALQNLLELHACSETV